MYRILTIVVEKKYLFFERFVVFKLYAGGIDPMNDIRSFQELFKLQGSLPWPYEKYEGYNKTYDTCYQSICIVIVVEYRTRNSIKENANG